MGRKLTNIGNFFLFQFLKTINRQMCPGTDLFQAVKIGPDCLFEPEIERVADESVPD